MYQAGPFAILTGVEKEEYCLNQQNFYFVRAMENLSNKQGGKVQIPKDVPWEEFNPNTILSRINLLFASLPLREVLQIGNFEDPKLESIFSELRLFSEELLNEIEKRQNEYCVQELLRHLQAFEKLCFWVTDNCDILQDSERWNMQVPKEIVTGKKSSRTFVEDTAKSLLVLFPELNQRLSSVVSEIATLPMSRAA